VLAGDPLRLKRMKVRFTKPVYPGDTLTTPIWLVNRHGGGEVVAYEVHNQDAVAVITEGQAEVAS